MSLVVEKKYQIRTTPNYGLMNLVVVHYCILTLDQNVIGATNKVVGDDNKRLYSPFVCLDYLKFRANNQKGRFEKVGLTVTDFAGINSSFLEIGSDRRHSLQLRSSKDKPKCLSNGDTKPSENGRQCQPEGSLDIGIDAVEVAEVHTDEVGENSVAEVSNVEAHVAGSNVPLTLAEVIEMGMFGRAFQFYEQYRRGKGFSMRHGRKSKNKNGEIVRYTLLCNRQGFWKKKLLEMPERKKEHKAVTRYGCPAELRIKPKAGTCSWYVS
ncbi:hypothetical protein PIB30_079039 [Stylosanthes scabra]|uniref:FAR1 domain-containing protein n=1 Tax=Stylosanthes scabra TaxID=79078 RepID=A0ABU6ZPS4_9FABA|nr:hypothetical protein [Stylosanthes scabra]